MDKQLLFALDIGTRSVIGLVGEDENGTVKLIASDREEHHTRAMLDGQIHDVREVAEVLNSVKTRLEAKTGKLTRVAVAAAGRALCTLRISAELDVSTRGTLTPEDERSLELAAIQTAQAELATSRTVPEPADYYCVGYSVVNFSLDGTRIKSLVGQRGKHSAIEAIATFLPRQVIDSLQSAIETVGLEMATLTLEPIAAINVLIPTTMRHLNLVLIDVGAGTSDVAITRDGSVIAYGMVPFAGDEITEAISQKYLLDFNVAETVKRQLNGKNKKISFTDVLGMAQKVAAKEIIEAMAPKVGELAQAIAAEIIALNNERPQAVLLVGGGALTPLLPEVLAEALDIPATRVAIRRPDSIEGITGIPAKLCTPDSVTPLGILKLAGGRTLNFINITVNERAIRLFNLSRLTIADALLAAGIDIRALRGRPGMGLTITVNDETMFIAGGHGSPGEIARNGQPAKLTDILEDRDSLVVTLGTDGATPAPLLQDIAPATEPLMITLDGKEYQLARQVTINGVLATPDTVLHDRDQICAKPTLTLKDALGQLAHEPVPAEYTYQINNTERSYKIWPQFSIDGTQASPDTPLTAGSVIEILKPPPPTLAEMLGIDSEVDSSITVSFNGSPCIIPLQRHTILVNGKPADINQPAASGSHIDFTTSPELQPLISDVLLAADFDPRSLPITARVNILLNGMPTEYTAIVKNGDSVEIKIETK
ncbi:cell division FtsA domain-containing protein [Sporomusa acidovorans]|uniref:Cell division protein FtsA n=1 Tax=Sporomusa acidovorans (strain ATCC 49682 / DSM 3132 / Mol) TaxID=1123286 RepID=A0ABZ3JA67_SPOA4|nr:cell division FtsA domain-containing protein [Sporomusa acidovorans]OZC22928.1 cell division protein FtsA [Sporomusa acidovorans DSM 3132]SDE94920.1 cell division protein FtsA [Sporomusa acidovorans]